MDYAALGLLALTGDSPDMKPLLKDGAPVIYELNEVPELFRQISINTEYVLHPEEICAEHFAQLVSNESVRQPEFLQAVKDVLNK
jgi:hypothetical protein